MNQHYCYELKNVSRVFLSQVDEEKPIRAFISTGLADCVLTRLPPKNPNQLHLIQSAAAKGLTRKNKEIRSHHRVLKSLQELLISDNSDFKVLLLVYESINQWIGL